MDFTNTSDVTLIIGGTGKTGHRVAERLRAIGRAVRIGSRRADPPFDWDDPSTWPPALAGVDSAYISYAPDLAFLGAAEAAGAAVAAGVGRLVLLSGRGEEQARRAEAAVLDTGADGTIVRASWFAHNFSEHFLLAPVLDGVIAFPAGDVAEPFVDVDDVADVAVAALTEDGHTGRFYDVTGPRLLTFADAAAELSRATGRTIRSLPVTPEQCLAGAVSQGVTVEEMAPFVDLFARVLDGRNAYVGDGVQQALGRAPRDFSDYARAAAVTGVWDADGSDR